VLRACDLVPTSELLQSGMFVPACMIELVYKLVQEPVQACKLVLAHDLVPTSSVASLHWNVLEQMWPAVPTAQQCVPYNRSQVKNAATGQYES
jgi:hypothetical protein